jgi:agmatinase
METKNIETSGAFCGNDGSCAHIEEAKIICLPIPFGKTNHGSGTENGPIAIIHASKRLELYDDQEKNEVYKKGIYTDWAISLFRLDNLSPVEMLEGVEKGVREHLVRDKFVFLLGGEHTATIASVRAHLEKYPNLSVVQLDARPDLLESYEGSPWSHACVMRQVIDLCPTLQVGIRSISKKERKFIEKRSLSVITSESLLDCTDHGIGAQLAILPSCPVYVTIDVSVLDPSEMPAVGNPEPGGLSWHHLCTIIRALSQKQEVVGFDIMGLSPIPCMAAPDLLCAKLSYKFLSIIWKAREEKTSQHGA